MSEFCPQNSESFRKPLYENDLAHPMNAFWIVLQARRKPLLILEFDLEP